MRRAAILLGTLALAGCGSGDDTPNASEPTLEKGEGSKLVDPATTPYINAIERRDDGSYFLTTNKGFWEVADGKAEKVTDSKVVTAEATSPMGTFLELTDLGTGDLIGSGHPDDGTKLPQFLGILRSADDGRTWRVVDRLGTADLHIVRRVGDTIFAWDAVLGAVLVSDLEFKKIAERFTPRSLVLDMVVDPADDERILISTETEMYRSTDQGRSWRPLAPERAARLTWVPSGELFRGTQEGSWQRSTDGGSTWKDVGKIPGEPWKIDSQSATEHDVALANGSIARTEDGGRTWSIVFDAPAA